MNKPSCPKCSLNESLSENRPKIVRGGFFYRKSDRKRVRRFKCLGCKTWFSRSTEQACYRQNKRQINDRIAKELSSGVSQRRIARLLNISRNTVVRKLIFLGLQAEKNLMRKNKSLPQSEVIEFDDLETFEHSKCKPLSITLAVEHGTRRILGFEVSQMPAKGKLAKLALKKYGPRKDERYKARESLFDRLQYLVRPDAQIKSDENPHYPATVKKYFPAATHVRFKGQRGSTTGQGELKKVRFDPLFSLNHTCAMLRANVNRLFRKTWCTTKKAERLRMHLAIYAYYHNTCLI